MTCTSCEAHINHAVNQLDGILNINTSYSNGKTEVVFDQSKITNEEIKNAVNSTGYSVAGINEK